jgi:hypothetical protein
MSQISDVFYKGTDCLFSEPYPESGLKSAIARQNRPCTLGLELRQFAIGRKVLGGSQKQFLFWDLRSKKAITSGCNPRGCRLQDEVEYLKVEL